MQRFFAIAAQNAAHRILRPEKRSRSLRATSIHAVESVDQKRYGQFDNGAPHVDIARRARQLATPDDAAWRQNTLEMKRVELLVKRLQSAFVGCMSTHVRANRQLPGRRPVIFILSNRARRKKPIKS